MGKTTGPAVGEKVWRELDATDVAEGKGGNGKIVKIDWSVDPREYIIIFARPTDEGTISRVSVTRDDIWWSDKYGGTWVIGELP